MFFLLYKRADTIFDYFPKITDQFPKASEDFPKLFRGQDERFRTFSNHFRRLPKIAEDCLGPPKKIRRCFDYTPTNLRVVEGAKEKCFQTTNLKNMTNSLYD